MNADIGSVVHFTLNNGRKVPAVIVHADMCCPPLEMVRIFPNLEDYFKEENQDGARRVYAEIRFRVWKDDLRALYEDHKKHKNFSFNHEGRAYVVDELNCWEYSADINNMNCTHSIGYARGTSFFAY